MKLHIERLERIPRVSRKTGKNFTSIRIRAGGEWYSGFAGKWNEDWAEGKTVEVDIEVNGKWKNLVTPGEAKAKSEVVLRLEALEARVANLEGKLAHDDGQVYRDDDIPPEFK